MLLTLIALNAISGAALAAPGDSMPELDEDWSSSNSNEPIPDSIMEQINSDYNEAVSTCDGNAGCVENADAERVGDIAHAQEIANNNAAESSSSSSTTEEAQSSTVDEVTETEEQKRARLERESMRPGEVFEEDCYGYPDGDTQNSSDFALKIDCILKTTNQDQSYFAPGWNSAPIENVIIKAINYLIVTIGSVSMLLIVIAGFMMITSPGNENQRSKATEILTSAIISLVIAFSSYIIVNAVVGLFF